MTEEKETEGKGYEVVKVPTDHKLAVQTPEGELMNELQLLTKLANDIEEIKKNIVG